MWFLQDAHEFLNYLLNQMAEILEAQDKAAAKQAGNTNSSNGGGTPYSFQAISSSSVPPSLSGSSNSATLFAPAVTYSSSIAQQLNDYTPQGQQQQQPPGNGQQRQQQQQKLTWVHDIFQGKLVSETKCLQCETVTRREEVFMDLPLEIDHNTSITACLKQFR